MSISRREYIVKMASAGFWILPVLSSGLLWLAFPGGGEIWPLLFVAPLPLLYVIRQSSPAGSFIAGLLCGWCHFMLALYWIVIVLGKYGGLPLFISVPALVLLSLYMGLFVACFALSAALVLRRYGTTTAVWIIPALWVGLDWLRSFAFSGFPWMDPGYALWEVPLFIQTADFFGHHGITYLLLLVNCLLLAVMTDSAKRRQKLPLVTAVAAVFVVAGIYGQYRIQQLDRGMNAGKKVTVGIVQGNIDQSIKWTPAEQQGTVATYVNLTAELFQASSGPELVVWPETALPFFPMTNPLMGELRALAMGKKVALLTGSPWFEEKEKAEQGVSLYNSAFLLQPDGEYGDMYFKSHLVPFGEYVPMKKMLPFLAPLVEAVGDFAPGTIEKPLVSGTIRGGVLICFESIFPDIARRWVDVGANVLINLTNDAWYGRSSAPSQSMAMTVLRAVETRRSLVRAANTGISAFVDPVGRVVASSTIFTTWSKSMQVSLMDDVSFYVRYGYLFGPGCLLLSCAAVLVAVRRRRTSPEPV
jgi:apolipoprotein N-acyltransferase